MKSIVLAAAVALSFVGGAEALSYSSHHSSGCCQSNRNLSPLVAMRAGEWRG